MTEIFPDKTHTLEQSSDKLDSIHILEAALFAADRPLNEKALSRLVPEEKNLHHVLEKLEQHYASRGIVLCLNNDGWFFITSPKVTQAIKHLIEKPKSLSRASLETLAVIAWHQPVTRAEIEKIRGVTLSSGLLDTLMERQLVRPLGRRAIPTNPIEWGTTGRFLQTFQLNSINDLPGLEELRKAGFMPTTETTIGQNDDAWQTSTNDPVASQKDPATALFDHIDAKSLPIANDPEDKP